MLGSKMKDNILTKNILLLVLHATLLFVAWCIQYRIVFWFLLVLFFVIVFLMFHVRNLFLHLICCYPPSFWQSLKVCIMNLTKLSFQYDYLTFPFNKFTVYRLLFRVLTIKYRKYPDFYILGEQKCGTTTLAHYLTNTDLQKHFIDPPMSLCDYNTLVDKDTLYFRGILGTFNIYLYKIFFPLKNNGNINSNNRLCFEACTSYLFLPFVRDILWSIHCNTNKNDSKNVKFIVLLRNPIKRLLSNINSERLYVSTLPAARKVDVLHKLKDLNNKNVKIEKQWQICDDLINFNLSEKYCKLYKQLEISNPAGIDNKDHKSGHGMSNEKFIELTSIVDRCGFVSKGFYDEHIEWYFEKFDRKQFLFLETDTDLNNDNIKKTLQKMCDFLQIDFAKSREIIDKIPNKKMERKNTSHLKTTLSEKTMDRLNKLYKPHNEKLYELIGRRLDW